jgi:hypothetical protein
MVVGAITGGDGVGFLLLARRYLEHGIPSRCITQSSTCTKDAFRVRRKGGIPGHP